MIPDIIRHARAGSPIRLVLLAALLAVLPARGQEIPARGQEIPAPDLVVLPVRLLDTSGEPMDQTAVHAARLHAMAGDLAVRLGETGRLRVAGITAEALERACPAPDSACILAKARRTGAPLAFVGVVHKSSTLIMQMFARIVETRTGSTRLARELNFRGDTDESWRRMTTFLAREILEAERPKK